MSLTVAVACSLLVMTVAAFNFAAVICPSSISDSVIVPASIWAEVNFEAANNVLISAAVWSSFAPVSIPSNLDPSAETSLPSTVPPTTMFPVVVITWDPKLGDILVPAIAALAFTSVLTIAPSAIFTLVIAESAIWIVSKTLDSTL